MIADPISFFAGPNVIHDHFKVSSKPIFIVCDDVLIALIIGYGKPLWAITQSHNSDEREYKDSAVGYISRERDS